MNIFLGIRNNRFIEALMVWSHQGKNLSRRTIIPGLIFCLAIAFSVRLFSLQVEPTISRDGIYYIRCAEIMQQSDDNPEKKNLIDSPGMLHIYSVYLSLSNIFNLTPAQLAIGTNIVIGSILPIILFCITQIMFKNSELSLAVAFLGALHPKLIQYSISIQREIPYFFFCGMFFICAIYFYLSSKWYWVIGMGAFASAGISLRFEGMELLLVALVAFVMNLYKKRDNFYKKFFLLMIFIFSFCFCTILCLIVLKRAPQENITMMLNRMTHYTQRSHK